MNTKTVTLPEFKGVRTARKGTWVKVSEDAAMFEILANGESKLEIGQLIMKLIPVQIIVNLRATYYTRMEIYSVQKNGSLKVFFPENNFEFLEASRIATVMIEANANRRENFNKFKFD